MTVLPLGFLGDFVSGGRSNLIGVIPARFRLWKNETKTRTSFHHLARSLQDLSHDKREIGLEIFVTRTIPANPRRPSSIGKKSLSQALGSFCLLIVLANQEPGNLCEERTLQNTELWR